MSLIFFRVFLEKRKRGVFYFGGNFKGSEIFSVAFEIFIKKNHHLQSKFDTIFGRALFLDLAQGQEKIFLALCRAKKTLSRSKKHYTPKIDAERPFRPKSVNIAKTQLSLRCLIVFWGPSGSERDTVWPKLGLQGHFEVL